MKIKKNVFVGGGVVLGGGGVSGCKRRIEVFCENSQK